jgi:hypothetical protein
MDVSQSPIDAVMSKCELGVIDAQQVKHCRMHVVAVDRILDSFIRPVIGCAIGYAALDAAACEP